LAKKRDELQVLICGIVKLNRDISNRGLRLNLERRTPGDVIDDVDREGIWFWHGNKLKLVKWSALKDRLHRAKKEFRSR
jgi:hypothetical protein